MEKMKMHSPNFAEENIEKLAALFPGCVTESEDETGGLKKSIDFDLLRQELSGHIVEGPQERYHLNWPGKRKALLTANAPIAKTLRPCREELDIGFRVLKVDTGNMADVYYTPDALIQKKLFQNTDNIKPDRSSEDLLFQVLLDWGVDLTLPIAKETLEDREVYFVDGNALAACFEQKGRITEDFCKTLAARQPLRVVFRDSGFRDDSAKINAEQIFKLMSPHTEVKTI